jgi:hypothetical protein
MDTEPAADQAQLLGVIAMLLRRITCRIGRASARSAPGLDSAQKSQIWATFQRAG